MRKSTNGDGGVRVGEAEGGEAGRDGDPAPARRQQGRGGGGADWAGRLAGVALEQEADRLLQAAGAFRRSTGILGGKRLREVASREESLDEVSEAVALELGCVDLWDEMDALAAWCGLTPSQKAALAMWRLCEYTQEEIARELGCSRRNVQRLLGRALRNVRRGAREFPGTARALFWEEVRRKSRLIYRKPGHGWRSGAGGGETS